MYHGWSDTDATPASSLFFYNAQADAFGEDALPSFLRLFFVPGMTHVCRAGLGVDTVSVIMDWVENGEAPDSLDTAGRRLFPYPATSVYDGSGEKDDPANWVKQ
jgi:feruloyl esterase